jgi:spermidine synthase
VPKAQPQWWRERDDGIGCAQSLKMTLLHREQSPFQLVEIYDHEAFGRLLVLDGYIQASQADEFIYHEMALHVPLLGRKRASADVLIIGGGEGGALSEALKQDFVKSATMVEIDKRVVELSAEFLGVNGDYDDPRANLVIENAADFVAREKAAGKTYDVILLDLTEPVGPSACLFTPEFIGDLVDLVSPTGVIVDSDSIFLSKDGGHFLQEESGDGENLVSIMLEKRLLPHVEMYRTNIPLYPGADFGFFIYSRDGISLAEPTGTYEGRHYSPAIHRAAFALPAWQQSWLKL